MNAAASPHRATTLRVSKNAQQVENPAMAPSMPSCRYTHIVASVPCLVRFDNAKADGKDLAIAEGQDGVLYLPADAPLVVMGGRPLVTVRSLGPDGLFCICPMGTA